MVMRPSRTGAARIAAAALVLVLAALVSNRWTGANHAGADKAPPAISITFGPSEIWQPSLAANQALHQCGSVSFTCVLAAMQNDSASEDAVAFYRLTGWFLVEIDTSVGPVMPAQVLNPWRANENQQPALLGGVPAVVLPEQEATLLNLAGEVERDPAWAAIKAVHPNVLFWQSSPALEPPAVSPSGGQRFIYDYRLLDGCHACAVLGLARVAFDFDPDGTFDGGRLLEMTQPPTQP
jgi:hypothetical protein